MPIDTAIKRRSSAAARRMPWMRRIGIAPTGTIGQAQRQAGAWVYSGILAGAAGGITISVADNGDGTATVTIAGSDAGATNTVYVSTANNLWGLVKTWTVAGSRVGDGTVQITTGRGNWFVFALSTATSTGTLRAVPVNNNNGTATVTVSGSAGGSITVRYVAVDGSWKSTPLAWTDGGTRVGDGAVTISTGAGPIFVYAEEDDVDASPPEFLYVSDGVESVWNQILDAVQARVRSLSLTGIASSRVRVLTMMDANEVRQVFDSTGGIIVAPAGAEQYREGDNATDDIDYPVVVALVVAANRDADNRTLRETWMLHRERVRKSLLNQPLTTPNANIFGCSLRTAPPVDQAAWKAMGLVSPVSLAFWSNEARGV